MTTGNLIMSSLSFIFFPFTCIVFVSLVIFGIYNFVVGYGDVVPAVWYTQLIVTSEMLLSVTYTVVIFAQGLSHFNTPLILEHDSSLPSENAPQ